MTLKIATWNINSVRLRIGLVERGLVRADGLRWPRVLPDLLRAYRMAGSS